MNRKKHYADFDLVIFIMMSVLVFFGILMIGSADGWVLDPDHLTLDRLMVRQFIGYVLGTGVIMLIWFCPYDLIKQLSIPAYIAVLILLILVLLFGTGAEAGDEVRRWLPIWGENQIQPSELAKISMIMLMAWIFDRYDRKVSHPAVVFSAALIALIPLALVYREPDLSTTLVLLAVLFACFFAAGIHWSYITAALLILTAGIILIVTDALSETPRILSAYQTERILSWLHPEDYALTSAYQSIMSRMAIGSGGFFGKGLFHGAGLVPIPTTDFIFGIIGEELGLIGGTFVTIFIFVLSARILKVGMKAGDMFGKLVCVGTAVMISFQALVHIGVTVAVLPNTGLPLPFISYGMSSLTANMAAIGLVLKINAQPAGKAKRSPGLSFRS